jgi:flagellar hook-basal body complex protein FliE
MNDLLIQRTNPLQQLKSLETKLQQQGKTTSPTDFAQVLSKAIVDVDQAQHFSNEQVEKVLSGEVEDVHTAMIAMKKAEMSFQMMMQVRNKLVEAYQEIMRMQV